MTGVVNTTWMNGTPLVEFMGSINASPVPKLYQDIIEVSETSRAFPLGVIPMN